MTKLIRLTIINAGGEFIGGIITDSDLKKNLKDSIERGHVSGYMEFEDGTDFVSSHYGNLFQIYGPHVPGATILLEESSDIDEDDYNRNYEEYFLENIDDTDIGQFTSLNPDLSNLDKSRFSNEDLAFFGQKIEKRIHFSVLFEVSERKSFDLRDVYIGSVNMDEVISGDEIISEVLYIPRAKSIEFVKEYLGNDYDDDCELSEFLTDIYYDAPNLREKIRNNHLMNPGDIEGKGEWENDYVKITDLRGNVLFEDGTY